MISTVKWNGREMCPDYESITNKDHGGRGRHRLGFTNVTSTVFESKDEPTQMTKQSLQLYTLLHTRKLYTLNSYANMFTVVDSIFPNTWIQFSNPKLN